MVGLVILAIALFYDELDVTIVKSLTQHLDTWTLLVRCGWVINVYIRICSQPVNHLDASVYIRAQAPVHRRPGLFTIASLACGLSPNMQSWCQPGFQASRRGDDADYPFHTECCFQRRGRGQAMGTGCVSGVQRS